ASRLAEPEALQEVATFGRGAGADWAGFHAENASGAAEQDPESATTTETEPAASDAGQDAIAGGGSREPVAPEKYVDTLPAMLDLLDRAPRVTDAAFAHLFGLIEAAHGNQAEYWGVPADSKGFKDT